MSSHSRKSRFNRPSAWQNEPEPTPRRTSEEREVQAIVVAFWFIVLCLAGIVIVSAYLGMT